MGTTPLFRTVKRMAKNKRPNKRTTPPKSRPQRAEVPEELAGLNRQMRRAIATGKVTVPAPEALDDGRTDDIAADDGFGGGDEFGGDDEEWFDDHADDSTGATTPVSVGTSQQAGLGRFKKWLVVASLLLVAGVGLSVATGMWGITLGVLAATVGAAAVVGAGTDRLPDSGLVYAAPAVPAVAGVVADLSSWGWIFAVAGGGIGIGLVHVVRKAVAPLTPVPGDVRKALERHGAQVTSTGGPVDMCVAAFPNGNVAMVVYVPDAGKDAASSSEVRALTRRVEPYLDQVVAASGAGVGVVLCVVGSPTGTLERLDGPIWVTSRSGLRQALHKSRLVTKK